MWRETSVTESPKTTAAPPAGTKPVTEDELHAILERLEASRDVFRQNRELREVLSRRDAESQALRTRNAELEEIVQKFAPMLLNIATTMGLAAKTETGETQNEP
jgi:hypothetical protein